VGKSQWITGGTRWVKGSNNFSKTLEQIENNFMGFKVSCLLSPLQTGLGRGFQQVVREEVFRGGAYILSTIGFSTYPQP
jgi:hypothetical protein